MTRKPSKRLGGHRNHDKIGRRRRGFVVAEHGDAMLDAERGVHAFDLGGVVIDHQHIAGGEAVLRRADRGAAPRR